MSPRQYQVLAAMADGSTQQVAAERLGIAYETLKGHLARAYEELRVTGLVEAYHKLGWLRVPTAVDAIPADGALPLAFRPSSGNLPPLSQIPADIDSDDFARVRRGA